MIVTALDGLCMAIADSVPGVSGGTIAFILGFYDRFIDALHNLFGREADKRRQAVLYLMKLGTGWCVGMMERQTAGRFTPFSTMMWSSMEMVSSS